MTPISKVCLILRRFAPERLSDRESRAVWAELKYFASREKEVLVVCEESEHLSELPKGVRAVRAHGSDLKLPLPGYVHRTDLMREFERQDLYVLHYKRYFPLSEIFREISGGKTLFVYHGLGDGAAAFASSCRADVLGVSVVHHAHLAITENEGLRDELAERFAFPRERTRVVPLPFERAAESPGETRPAYREIAENGDRGALEVSRALATGSPVVAPDDGSLHEVVGRGGLLYEPGDSHARSAAATRLSSRAGEALWPADRPLKIVVVSPRAGPEVLGGAEAHLAMLARLMKELGHDVEIASTQARSHSKWTNELPTNAEAEGIPVRRFPVDPFDQEAHDVYSSQAFFQRPEHRDAFAEEMVRNFAHSSALLAYLQSVSERTDLFLTGPYLHGITVDVARAFPSRCVVMPCLHDEWLARLKIYRQMLRNARGIMFNTPEEMAFAAHTLRVSHPRSMVVGYGLDPANCAGRKPRNITGRGRPYVFYAGRIEANKNLGQLVEGFLTFKRRHPDIELDLALAGQGSLELPQREDIVRLGFLDRPALLDAYANAKLFCLPSLYESFSIVIMESWLNGVPVAVHGGCTVTRAHVERSDGGWIFFDAMELAGVLEDACAQLEDVTRRGKHGRAYVLEHHTEAQVRERLREALSLYGRDLAETARREAEAIQQTLSFDRFARAADEFMLELADRGSELDRARHETANVEKRLSELSAETGGGWPRPALGLKLRALHWLRNSALGRALVRQPRLFRFMRRLYHSWER